MNLKIPIIQPFETRNIYLVFSGLRQSSFTTVQVLKTCEHRSIIFLRKWKDFSPLNFFLLVHTWSVCLIFIIAYLYPFTSTNRTRNWPPPSGSFPSGRIFSAGGLMRYAVMVSLQEQQIQGAMGLIPPPPPSSPHYSKKNDWAHFCFGQHQESRLWPSLILCVCAEGPVLILNQSDLSTNDKKLVNHGISHWTWPEGLCSWFW